MKYRALIPIIICTAVGSGCITVIESNLEFRVNEGTRSQISAVQDTAKADSLSEKQRFYRDMKGDGWEWYGNSPNIFSSFLLENIIDVEKLSRDHPEYEYTVRQAWLYPDKPDSAGEVIKDMYSVWRRRKS